MKTIIIICLIGVGLAVIIPVAFRIRKDIKKKLAFGNTYAIQNASTGLCVRPYNAGYKNENAMMVYTVEGSWIMQKT